MTEFISDNSNILFKCLFCIYLFNYIIVNQIEVEYIMKLYSETRKKKYNFN